MNTLIIGANTDGIGDAIYDEIMVRWDDWATPESRSVFIPTKEEFDVTSRHSVSRWFAQHDGLEFDQIIYSAGFNQLGMIGELDKVHVRDMFEVNVLGFIRLLDHLIMHQGKAYKTASGKNYFSSSSNPDTDYDLPLAPVYTGSIVAIVSDSAYTPMRGSIGYASSKAALAHAIRCAARELAPHYRVNGVAPAMVEDTDMTRMVDRVVPELRGWTAAEARKYEESLIPMQRRATKQEVAQLAVSVLEGPEFLTGAIIPITGGK
jgi:NAD(P)-dependent dehydrogenase (short-subunit alcohol dehydrogenase family)